MLFVEYDQDYFSDSFDVMRDAIDCAYEEQDWSEVDQRFHRVAEPLFIAHPELHSFTWCQFTCHDPDGPDSHQFYCGRSVDEVEVNGSTEEELVDSLSSDARSEALALLHAIHAVSVFLNGFKESRLRMIFGCNVAVLVTRDSVEVTPTA